MRIPFWLMSPFSDTFLANELSNLKLSLNPLFSLQWIWNELNEFIETFFIIISWLNDNSVSYRQCCWLRSFQRPDAQFFDIYTIFMIVYCAKLHAKNGTKSPAVIHVSYSPDEAISGCSISYSLRRIDCHPDHCHSTRNRFRPDFFVAGLKRLTKKSGLKEFCVQNIRYRFRRYPYRVQWLIIGDENWRKRNAFR